MTALPKVERVSALWCRVSGVLFRAVDPQHRDGALAGSRLPGRYSSAEQPTLYLSSSADGVSAALIAHAHARSAATVTLELEVDATRVLDLRDPVACSSAGLELSDAMAPWQRIVGQGGEPPSWRVRQRLDALGADGLIDPSRQAPGLWHLALFRWDVPGAPSVRLL